MIKICYVCTGNTCRSIMAERLTKKLLKQQKIDYIKVSSRGIDAKGDNITENAKKALKVLNASSANRKSVKLGKIDKNTLYVTMSQAQKNYIIGKVISFQALVGHDIMDPYGQTFDVYYQTALQLLQGIKILLNKIRESL